MKSHHVWAITYNAKEYFNAIYIGYCLIMSEVRFTFLKNNHNINFTVKQNVP